MNDKSSEVRALFNDKRKYVLLEEVDYKTKRILPYKSEKQKRKQRLNNINR